MAVVTCALLLFHYLVIALNFRIALGTGGTAISFIRVGLVAYLLVGLLDLFTSFRGIAEQSQFTMLTAAVEQLGRYGGISMMFFGAIYYIVPRLTGTAWASGGLMMGHRALVLFGVAVLVIT